MYFLPDILMDDKPSVNMRKNGRISSDLTAATLLFITDLVLFFFDCVLDHPNAIALPLTD